MLQLESPTGYWASAAAPPPVLTVSEWADATRILPSTSGSKGALWRTDSTPYLRGVMDAVHEPGVTKIALRKAAQIGGSEALHNILGYFIEHDPCPTLFVHPSVNVAEEWSKERLSDMIRTTPALADVIREKRPARGSHEAESTLSLKMFPGGFLALGGANTPNTFARRSVRLAIGDDVDRFPAVVGDEGDPADLLVNRTTTFYDGLTIFVSTPTLKNGRIDTLYQRSDQRQYVVACPECGRTDWITWSDADKFRVRFDERDPHTARLECPSPERGGCGAHLFEPERRAMIAAGEWISTATAQESGLVGFHLPAMLSTLGSVTLPALVEKWLSARAKGKESLRVFINTSLAEGWEDHGTRMEAHALLSKREDYGEDVEVPAGASVLTAGVDVQVDRFVVQVLAWGPADERWVIDWLTVPGDPKRAETHEALLVALSRRYRHALGVDVAIHATCIDSGYATEEVYDFVLTHQVRRIYATKGYGGREGEPVVGKESEKRSGSSPRPVKLYPINVDDAKRELFSSVALSENGPGRMHFSEALDEEYFSQLCAEHRETRYNKSNVATHAVWVQDRERNEALDTAILARAAYLIFVAKRKASVIIRQMADGIAAAAVTRASNPASDDSAMTLDHVQPIQVAPVRRMSRSSYLGR